MDPHDSGEFPHSGDPVNPAASVSTPAAVGVKHDKLRIEVSLEDVPEPVSGLLQKLAKPHSESKLRGFVKDYSTLLTPIMAAIVAAVVAYFGNKFDDHISKDTLDKITTEFVKGDSDPNLTAMKLAAYGDKALPAVKIALAADDQDLRNGAVQIASQMYFTETVDRESLTKSMLNYYDNPVLRLGVVEWFSTIESSQVPLGDLYRNALLQKLQKTFGDAGERCKDQDAQVAQAVSSLLLTGPWATNKAFTSGMNKNCPGNAAAHTNSASARESK